MSAFPASAAAIRGVVQFTGTGGEPKKLPVTIDQYVCGKDKDAEDLQVERAAGRAQRRRVAAEPAAGRPRGAAPAKVEMDQKGCVFVPHVVLVPAGGTVEFLNSDRLLHNLHSVGKDNPPFNRTQPRGRAIPMVFAKPEIVRVDCDLHSWMRAWVVVADHPFYALTQRGGRVRPGRRAARHLHAVDLAGGAGHQHPRGHRRRRGRPRHHRVQGATLIFFDASHAAEWVGSAMRAEHAALRPARW